MLPVYPGLQSPPVLRSNVNLRCFVVESSVCLLSAGMCGRTRNRRLGTRAIGWGDCLRFASSHDHPQSIARISDLNLRRVFREPPPSGHLLWFKDQPDDGFCASGPTDDLALLCWNDESTQLASFLSSRSLASPRLLSSFDPSLDSKVSVSLLDLVW